MFGIGGCEEVWSYIFWAQLVIVFQRSIKAETTQQMMVILDLFHAHGSSYVLVSGQKKRQILPELTVRRKISQNINQNLSVLLATNVS